MTTIQTPYGELSWDGEAPPTEKDTVVLAGHPVMLGSAIGHTNGDLINYLPPAPGDEDA